MNTDFLIPNYRLIENAVNDYEEKIGVDRLNMLDKIYKIACATIFFGIGAGTVASMITRTISPFGYAFLASVVATCVTRAVSGLFGFKIQKFEAYTLLKPLVVHPVNPDQFNDALVKLTRVREDTERQHQRNQGIMGRSWDLYMGLLSLDHIRIFCDVESSEELFVKA